MDYLKAIEAHSERLTPTQRVLAEYIRHNPESVLFMTIGELAKAASVSQATIVRFCHLIGYEGYTQLTKEVQQVVQSQMSTAGRFKLARGQQKKGASSLADGTDQTVFTRILTHELDNLDRLATGIRIDDFETALKLMQRADRVAIVGCMASASLAAHFGYMLAKILPQVDVIQSDDLSTATKILRLTKESVAFLLAFPRYPSQTLRLGRMIVTRGVQTVGITDGHQSPISRLGRIVFHIHVGIPSFVDAYAAPLTFINALCTGLAERYPDQAVERLDSYDRFAAQAKLFYKRTKRGRPNGDRRVATRPGAIK